MYIQNLNPALVRANYRLFPIGRFPMQSLNKKEAGLRKVPCWKLALISVVKRVRCSAAAVVRYKFCGLYQ